MFLPRTLERINTFQNKYIHLPIQAKASIWFLICLFFQRGISAITTPIFTRLMTPFEYGQYSVFNSWYGIITIIVGLSLTAGVHLQGLIKFNDERDVFSSSLQGLLTSLVLFWMGIYLLYQDFWNRLFSMTSTQMIALLVMVWTTSIFNFWANEQMVFYQYRTLVFVTLFVAFLKPLLGIYLITTSTDKVTARIISLLIVELLGYSWLFIKRIKNNSVFFSKKFWKYALCFNLPLVPHYLSQIVLNSSDRIMIRNMIGAAETGIYDLAYSVSLVMYVFNMAILQAIKPWLFQKIKDKDNNNIAPIAYLSLIIIATVNILLVCVAPEIVSIFAPPSYYEAIWVVPPVAMSVFFIYCYDLFGAFAFYYEKTKFIMIASVVAALANIVLNYIFINLFGYIAAGYTTLVCFIIYASCHYVFMQKVCKQYCEGNYPYKTSKLLVISCLFLLLGAIILFTYKHPWIRYGVIAFAVAMVFCFRTIILRNIRLAMNCCLSVKKSNL